MDNCTGQNKNHFMMFYLMWHVLAGLHKEITISFLLVGHTKFSPDWCFCLFKQLYCKTNMGSIHDSAVVVKQSANVNHLQFIGEYDGTYVSLLRILLDNAKYGKNEFNSSSNRINRLHAAALSSPQCYG